MLDEIEYSVCVNLTRLLDAAKGSGGAGWFGIEACVALAKCTQVTVLTRMENADYVKKSLRGRGGRRVLVEVVEGDLEKWLSAPQGSSFDVYVDPLNGLEPFQIPRHIASIAVIHDLMFQRDPYVFSQKEIEFRSRHYCDAIRRADLVLTVAEREAIDIAELFPRKPVRVVEQPAYFVAPPPMKRPAGRPVLLFSPGVQWNHKNHFRLVSAFLYLLEQGRIDPKTRLCLSAILPVEANHQLLKPLIESSPHGKAVIQLPYLSRNRFISFMERCDALVLPSIHEGYGIPLIEAVAGGRPILTSRVPSIESLDLVPDFVRIIEDPKDVASMAEALEDFILTLPTASPAADNCPSTDSFAKQLLAAVRDAVAARRLRPTMEALPRLKIKRREMACTVLALTLKTSVNSAVPVISGATVKLFGCESRGQSGAIVACQLQARRALTLHFAHEILVSERRFVLIGAVDDVALVDSDVLRRAIERLEASPNQARIRLVDLGLDDPKTLPGAALPPTGLFDLETLDIPFEATLSEILAKMEVAPVLYEQSARRALIIDPSLKNPNGHHLAVATALARSLKADGFATSVACHYAMSFHAIDGADRTYPILSDFLYEQNGDIGLAQAEFANALEMTGVCSEDIVFAFCATPTMLTALALELGRRRKTKRPLVVIRFDRPEWRTPQTSVGYKEVFDLINALGLRENFSFTVESKGLQRCFALSSGEAMPIRFNFVSAADKAVEDILGVEQTADDTIIISFVGEAREEKGFQHLPGVLTGVLAELGDIPVKFRIQCGANNWNQTLPIVSAHDKLRQMALNDSRIELLDGALPEDEYLELIRGADIVFLPYDPPQYRIRGSGVATEAAAFGVEMIVSHGLDIVDTYPDALVTESGNYSVSALTEALLDRIRAIARKSVPERQANRKSGATDIVEFARSFIVSPSAETAAKGGLILWIANDTRGEGSDAVYRSQISYLEERGYFVMKVVAPYPARWRLERPWQFDATKFAKDHEVVLNFEPGAEIEHAMDDLQRGGDVLTNFTTSWNLTVMPELLEQLLQNCPPKLAVVNYAHHRPIIERLVGTRVPMIVETHDIQALQYAIQLKCGVKEMQLEKEMQLVRSFDHIVSISKSEAVLFEKHCGSEKTSWCMPFVNAPRVQLRNAWENDLLFVGSAHHANVESLKWFLREVYRPYLHPQGLSLAIVGDSGMQVDVTPFGDRVTCPGRVTRLEPWYQNSGLAVLPVVSGAGVPIKVIDAMTRGMPFVLTDFPAKAMGLTENVPVARTPLEFAQQVLNILCDPAERERRAVIGVEFVSKFASQDSYDSVWDKVLAHALSKGAN